MKSIIKILSVFILLSGCYWGGDSYSIQDEDKLHLVFIEEPANPELVDSLKIHISLNDTIFRRTDIDRLLSLKWSDSLYDSLMRVIPRPFVNFFFENVSSKPYYVALDCGGGACATIPYNVCKTYILMDADIAICIEKQVIWIPHNVLSPDCLVLLNGNSSYASEYWDTIDVFFVYREYFNKCDEVDTGLYWVQVRYQNQEWKDTIPCIWTGVAVSDTVWFRIVE